MSGTCICRRCRLFHYVRLGSSANCYFNAFSPLLLLSATGAGVGGLTRSVSDPGWKDPLSQLRFCYSSCAVAGGGDIIPSHMIIV